MFQGLIGLWDQKHNKSQLGFRMTILLEAQAAGERGLDNERLHGVSSQVLLLVSSEKAKPCNHFNLIRSEYGDMYQLHNGDTKA